MTQEMQFHLIVLGIILFLVAAACVAFKKQGLEKRESLFHSLFGLLTFSTLVLIFVGAMVASTRSGMAFMDWPTSNGLIWPGLDKWIHQKDMFWEHFHRLIAEGVGVLSILALIWSFFVFDKKYVKASAILLLAVIVQGIFGGLTVGKLTAWWTSTLHGVVAQLVFCYMVVVWYRTGKKGRAIIPTVDNDSWLRSMPKLVCIIVIIQLILGASFRHKMKVAQFSSSIDEAGQISLLKNNQTISARTGGDYNIQIKVPAAGQYEFSLGEGLTLSKEFSSGNHEVMTLGHLQLETGNEYTPSFKGNIEEIKLTGPERIDIKGEEKPLPFVIVYKEVLEGNKHLLWAHIAFALVVTCFVLFLGFYLFKKRESLACLKTPSLGLIITVVIQVFLGLIAFLTVSERQKNIYDQTKTILTSAHLANGALLLAFCVLAMFLCRWGFEKSATEE